jgi:hypothetical protein
MQSMPLSHFSKIHFNINSTSKFRSSNLSLSLRCPHYNPVCTYPLSNTCHMPYQSHLPWYDHPNNIWWAIQTTTLLIKQLPIMSIFWWRTAYVAQKRNIVRNYRRWLHKVFEQTFFVLGPCWRFLQESWRTAWDLWRNACSKIQCIRESGVSVLCCIIRCWCVVLYNTVFR